MKNGDRGWNRAVVWRYALLQLPEIALLIIFIWVAGQFIAIPLWLTILIPVGWIIKDLLLFPYIWPSYDTRHKGNVADMTGKTGVVVRSPHPKGIMLLNGEFWQIRREKGAKKLPAGIRVVVTAQNGLILTVRPLAGQKQSTIGENAR